MSSVGHIANDRQTKLQIRGISKICLNPKIPVLPLSPGPTGFVELCIKGFVPHTQIFYIATHYNISARGPDIHITSRSPRLDGLAAEIIQHITNALEPADLCSLRLVSRETERKTLQSFTAIYFSTLMTDSRVRDISRLKSISESSHFAKSIKCLHITELERPDLSSQSCASSRQTSAHLPEQLVGARLLKYILVKKLVNRRSFKFDVRYIDSVSVDHHHLFTYDAVEAVLSVIAETGLPVKSFSMDWDFKRHAFGLDTEWLQQCVCQEPQFLAGWAHLEELHLRIGIKGDRHDWVQGLISHAPRLRKLGLAVDYRDGVAIHSILSIASPPRIEELSLNYAFIDADCISKLSLQYHGCLRSLFLNKLVVDTNVTWARTLLTLKDNFPHLESFSILDPWERRVAKSLLGGPELPIFSRLPQLPIVPGSEIFEGGIRKAERRVSDALKRPFTLMYCCTGQNVEGVSYQGSDMINSYQ